MSMIHRWGDKDFDWAALEDARRIVSDTCRRYGRIAGPSKEKFGTLRFYAKFNTISLTNIVYPGGYRQLPKPLGWLDRTVFEPVFKLLFGNLWHVWQQSVYSWAYNRAIKKHPHIREEILEAADYLELIDGAEDIVEKYRQY